LDLYRLTIAEVRALLDKKEVSIKDVLESIFTRIDAVEDHVRAFVTVIKEKALEAAEGMQEKIEQQGTMSRTSVLGVPLAIKDNMCTKGIRTTCSSNILHNFIPPYESTVTSRLSDQGYVLVGKTNLDEFAMGSSTENSGFFTTKNPWDFERIPGGSSGGSAAAVAADECIAALGSDTGDPSGNLLPSAGSWG